MRTRIIVTATVTGFHQWSNPVEGVEHLGSYHRHRFGWRAEFIVGHDDRAIEFQLAQRELEMAAECCAVAVLRLGMDFGGKSCEMLAKETRENLPPALREACLAIEVWEDGENGARVEFDL